MRSLRHARVIRSAARQKIRLTTRPTLSLLHFLPLDFVALFSSVDVVTDGVVAGNVATAVMPLIADADAADGDVGGERKEVHGGAVISKTFLSFFPSSAGRTKHGVSGPANCNVPRRCRRHRIHARWVPQHGS